MCAQALKVALGIPFQARPFNVLRRLTEEPQTQQTIMNARAYEWGLGSPPVPVSARLTSPTFASLGSARARTDQATVLPHMGFLSRYDQYAGEYTWYTQ